MEHDDRRAHPRHPLWAQIMVRHGQINHVLEVLNLSRGGALIDLGKEPRPRWLEMHRTLDVQLVGPDGSAVISSVATVVRIVETVELRTFAVQFEALVDQDIVANVLRAAGRPPPLPPSR